MGTLTIAQNHRAHIPEEEFCPVGLDLELLKPRGIIELAIVRSTVSEHHHGLPIECDQGPHPTDGFSLCIGGRGGFFPAA